MHRISRSRREVSKNFVAESVRKGGEENTPLIHKPQVH